MLIIEHINDRIIEIKNKTTISFTFSINGNLDGGIFPILNKIIISCIVFFNYFFKEELSIFLNVKNRKFYFRLMH